MNASIEGLDRMELVEQQEPGEPESSVTMLRGESDSDPRQLVGTVTVGARRSSRHLQGVRRMMLGAAEMIPCQCWQCMMPRLREHVVTMNTDTIGNVGADHLS